MILFALSKYFGGSYGAGQWKDIAALKLILNAYGHPYKTIEFDGNEYGDLLNQCDECVSDLILYYSFWPDLLREIGKRAPWIRLHVRTVNAEALQHWQRAEVTFRPSYRNARSIYGFVRLLWRDSLCRKRADTMLGISKWDNRHYWGRLPGEADVLDVPYCSPWSALRPHSKPRLYSERDDAIVCMAGGRDPIGRRMVEGFTLVAEQFRKCSDGREWKFLLSRGILTGGQDVPASPAVDLLEQLDEPWDLLCSSRAVAVLTPLGFGAKTTVIDGIAAGCHTIVHPVIARRLPPEVSKFCIICDPGNAGDVEDLKGRLKEPPPANNVNDILRLQALTNLRKALADSNWQGDNCRLART